MVWVIVMVVTRRITRGVWGWVRERVVGLAWQEEQNRRHPLALRGGGVEGGDVGGYEVWRI